VAISHSGPNFPTSRFITSASRTLKKNKEEEEGGRRIEGGRQEEGGKRRERKEAAEG
jgi:hypothetical protein